MNQVEKSMFSITNLNKKKHKLSEREQYLRKSVNLRPVTLQQVLDYIALQDIDPELKAALMKKASRYPNQALQRFVNNFNQILNTEQRNLGKNYTVEGEKVAKDENAVRPTRQYHTPEQLKLKPKPVITAKKIDIESIDADPFSGEDPYSEVKIESQTPSFSVDVHVNLPESEPLPNPKPAMPPQPQVVRAKPVIFSSTLSPEDFE